MTFIFWSYVFVAQYFFKHVFVDFYYLPSPVAQWMRCPVTLAQIRVEAIACMSYFSRKVTDKCSTFLLPKQLIHFYLCHMNLKTNFGFLIKNKLHSPYRVFKSSGQRPVSCTLLLTPFALSYIEELFIMFYFSIKFVFD